MINKLFNYKILPITILILHMIVFFYLRYFYLLEYPEASYAYHKVSAHPHYMLEETVFVYSLLIFLFIVGYLIVFYLFAKGVKCVEKSNTFDKYFIL
jgi:hypothetical protein